MDRILLLSAIGAVLGLILNYVAVQLIIRPKRLLDGLFEGGLSGAHNPFAQTISSVIAQEIDAKKEIDTFFDDPSIQAKVKKAVLEFLDVAIRTRLPVAMPMAAMFLSPQLIDGIKDAFSSDIDGFIRSTLSEVASSVGEGLDLEKIAQMGISKLSNSTHLQELQKSVTRKLLLVGALQNAVTGALIGSFAYQF